jgi:hypothetical protein
MIEELIRFEPPPKLEDLFIPRGVWVRAEQNFRA